MKRLIASAAIVAALVLPVGAYADTVGYATPSDHQVVRGVITSINGKYGLTVQDGEGFLDSVTMHQGTIINPTGLQLEPGMRVAIAGHADGTTFDANRIDGPLDAEKTLGRITPSTSLRIPQEIPNGTFQTDGPTAAGGG
jgi:hypothetical protein